MESTATHLDPWRRLGVRQQTRPLDYMRWLPAQWEYLHATERYVCLRIGNQSQGKTTAALAERIYRALGRHPYKWVPPPPIEQWIICSSWPQSIALQTKLWNLAPKDEVDPSTIFDEVKGFRGKNPALKWRNGSITRIKTTKQGTLDLSSATIHDALFDEPPERPRTFAEVQKRVQRNGGPVHLDLTPVNADVGWLRGECEAKKIRDIHYRLEPRHLEFLDEDGHRTGELICVRDEHGNVRPCDAEWIASVEAESLSYEVPVVVHGEWEFRSVDRVFEAFRTDHHVVPDLLSSPHLSGEVKLCLGIDYGEDRLRTAAVLVYVDDSGQYPRIFVVREYAPQTTTSTIDMDARSILQMLGSAGDRWADLDFAWGDKKYSDTRGGSIVKSNGMMLREIEKVLGVAQSRRGMPGLRPIIRGVKKGAGAGRQTVARGIRWLHECMIRPGHFFVDSSCEWMIEGLFKWDGDSQSKYKDVIDALRYSLRGYIIPTVQHRPRQIFRRYG